MATKASNERRHRRERPRSPRRAPEPDQSPSCACASEPRRVTLARPHLATTNSLPTSKERALSNGPRYTPEQQERLRAIHARLIEARRELDALIGDAYLRPRASIVPVHFLDLASAVEKLRWAEKEWRELDRELESGPSVPVSQGDEDEEGEDEEAELVQIASN